MSSKRCVVGIGEVLMDVFENGEATLGGAPLNVTYHIHQLLSALSKGEGVFVSAVGSDFWGSEIRSAISSVGMSTEYIGTSNWPTGSALVFESCGGAGFEIRQDVAWDCIALNPGAIELARRSDAVVFGSLAQRSEASRISIQKFVSEVRGQRMYDVNLRRNSTNGLAGYSAEIIAESLNLATIVKMNDAELNEIGHLVGLRFAGDERERMLGLMEQLAQQYSLVAVAVTRGAKGAILASDGQFLTLPDSTLDQSLVHPVGAGDSFGAGLLFGILQGWRPEDSLALADLLSSYVVRQVSATPPIPVDLITKVRELALEGDLTGVRSKASIG